MKRAFIIDLNVMHFAGTLKNEKGEEDLSSKKLIVGILKYCNTVIVPKGYKDTYYKFIFRFRNSNEFVDSGISGLWMNFWTTEGKLDWTEDEPSVLEEEGMFHNDDIDFVRLAAHIDSEIVFVSTDNRLRNRLNELGMTDKYGFNILRPEDAINYVGDKD